MERIATDDLDPDDPGEGVRRWRLSEPLGTTDLALNRYRIAPREGMPWGLHAHADQEEVFVVLDGEATFETVRPSDDGDRVTGEVTVGPGEAVRFAPGEFQRGRNDGEGDLVVLAIGAPRDSDDVRVPVECPGCERGDLRLAVGPTVTLTCPDCGVERVPEDCPACGGELRVTLDDAGTAVECGACGAGFDRAPLADPG